MIDVDVNLYLLSRERIALLKKVVAFTALPRVREFVKIRNREQGDYFAFTVIQVTHREGEIANIWLQLTSTLQDKTVLDLTADEELDDYIAGYVNEGWTLASLKPNRLPQDVRDLNWAHILNPDDEGLGESPMEIKSP